MPLLDLLFLTLGMFLFIGFIFLVVYCFMDVLRSDINPLAKALWILVLFIPVLGVLAYLVVRGGSMHERSVDARATHDEMLHGYVRSTHDPSKDVG